MSEYQWVAKTFQISLYPSKENTRKIILTFIEQVANAIRYNKNNIASKWFSSWKDPTESYHLTLYFLAKIEDHNELWSKVDDIRKEIDEFQIHPGKDDKDAVKFILSMTDDEIDFQDKRAKRGIQEWKNPTDTSPF